MIESVHGPTRKGRAANDWIVMDEADSGFERLVCLFSYHNLDKIPISIQIHSQMRCPLRSRGTTTAPKLCRHTCLTEHSSLRTY